MTARNIEFALIVLLSLYCLYFFRTMNATWHFIGAVNLIVHEGGHLVFGPLGEFISIAGGTLAQVLLPLFAFANFWRLGQRFVAVAMLMWLSTNLFDIAVYESDAIDMAMPLVTVGGNGEGIIHDWNYMLSAVGLLPYTAAISTFIKFLGFVSIATGLYLAWRSRTEKPGTRSVAQ